MGRFHFSTSSISLRRTKWHKSPYTSKWQQNFNEKQALETLEKILVEENPQNHLLSALTGTFHSYGCRPIVLAYSLVINYIAQKSLFNQLPPLLDHIENSDTFEPPERIFVDLIRNFGEANMVKEAYDLFFKMPKFRCSPSIISLNMLLSTLSKKKDGLVLVHEVLKRTPEMNIRLETSSFHILIKGLCQIGKVKSSIEILNLMQDHDCVPDAEVYSIIFSSLCKYASSSEVKDFLDEMGKAGFSPNEYQYYSLINLFVKDGRSMDALELLNRMKLEGIKPNVYCYTSILDGLISISDFERVDFLFDEMLVLGIVPDVVTYTVYINGLCKQGNFEGGIKMLACMEELGCKPNVFTYNTLMAGYTKDGNLNKASNLFKKMCSKGVEGNLHTHRILIDGFLSIGEFREAYVLLKQSLNKGHVPQPSSFDTMICGLCEMGSYSEAFEVLEIMIDRSLAPNARTWETLLSKNIIVLRKRWAKMGQIINILYLVHNPVRDSVHIDFSGATEFAYDYRNRSQADNLDRSTHLFLVGVEVTLSNLEGNTVSEREKDCFSSSASLLTQRHALHAL
ncbi:hypothetical protein H6P81_009376 [Aristolochia fimbriata]|uniref:Pentatricopeptide repeat-containing protein n=1 Tax=Aristolochia fimbriata TaxID=158543 RepID=A0AAV7ENE3_ARIFI|nr:hypothetical protein H6P81_009376 [Aristolochia fimbriata]